MIPNLGIPAALGRVKQSRGAEDRSAAIVTGVMSWTPAIKESYRCRLESTAAQLTSGRHVGLQLSWSNARSVSERGCERARRHFKLGGDSTRVPTARRSAGRRLDHNS